MLMTIKTCVKRNVCTLNMLWEQQPHDQAVESTNDNVYNVATACWRCSARIIAHAWQLVSMPSIQALLLQSIKYLVNAMLHNRLSSPCPFPEQACLLLALPLDLSYPGSALSCFFLSYLSFLQGSVLQNMRTI